MPCLLNLNLTITYMHFHECGLTVIEHTIDNLDVCDYYIYLLVILLYFIDSRLGILILL